MINKGVKGSFPSQAVSDAEKMSAEYGAKVGRAIEHEWYSNTTSSNMYMNYRQNFHNLRLYARGEQSVRKYKDELSINGDLSYLNLDWKPVPIIPKFVDIVVNGMADRSYDVKAYSQDPAAIKERTDYVEAISTDMNAKELNDTVFNELGVDIYNTDQTKLPETNEELQLHMQLDYKQSIEIAEEEAINSIFDKNKYDEIIKRINYDLVVIGIGAAKSSFNKAEGIKIEYVDPADLVYSYTDSPNFEDIYYVGEVKQIYVNELKKQFPELTDEELESYRGYNKSSYDYSNYDLNNQDENAITVLYFEYKTHMNQTYKIKKTATGGNKAIEKDDTFNPPKSEEFEKVSRAIEVIYEGVKIVGSNKLLKWELKKNMMRPKSDTTKAQMSYAIVAPRKYRGKINSLVERITGFADMIQLTHLKLQQVMSRMVPDGVYVDADSLAEIDLGNGTNYNPQEALNMYFQTGSVIGRSMTQDGDMNRNRLPITELTSSNGQAKLSSLINTYQYYLQMIRDVTGLNEARDGSVPDKNALVGLQKLAAANSNTATRHILQSSLYITLTMAECISMRVSDVIEYSPTRESFIKSLGKFNVATLEEMASLHLHDFGIFIELAPDEEEKTRLENNIQVALQQKSINLEDAIDIREVRNIKLANQLLKIRRTKKEALDRERQKENIQAQGQANQQSAQAAALAETQKQQAIAETKAQLAQAQAQLDLEKLEREAAIKKELMQLEFNLNMRLKEVDKKQVNEKDKFKEDRKDERTRIQASQQSELIEQRKTNAPAKNFESAGFDNLGGFGLEQFDPR
jgi:hypothetical protein|tara:strand:+ start:1110 stop:3515 length:2406 start_codon:yes stop_codon:yes gene_type:complete